MAEQVRASGGDGEALNRALETRLRRDRRMRARIFGDTTRRREKPGQTRCVGIGQFGAGKRNERR